MYILLKYICLFWAVQGLCCWVGFSLIAENGGYSLVVRRGHLILVASRVWSMGSRHESFSSYSSRARELRLRGCGSWASFPYSRWNPPRSGIKPVLAGLHWQVNALPLSHLGSPLWSIIYWPTWQVPYGQWGKNVYSKDVYDKYSRHGFIMVWTDEYNITLLNIILYIFMISCFLLWELKFTLY